jgi:hypothetical protein
VGGEVWEEPRNESLHRTLYDLQGED